ncbi:MAG: fructosamine kinase family protein [Pseudomonadota bacterium]
MRSLGSQVADHLGARVVSIVPVSGGDVAEAFKVVLDDGTSAFAKTHRNPPARFFTTEAAGLSWLRDAGTVRVPRVLAVSDDPPFLVLQWIDIGRETSSTEADFGRALAALHQCGAASFGREDGRRTGSRGLPNDPCATWPAFYAHNRLLPLAKLASDSRALPGASVRAIESIASRLDDLGGPAEPPARLHGDLWAGNRVIDLHGSSWLIDPAAHGGHREFDLAMMRLFGGFGETCFDAYAEVTPLASGWRERVPLHQLAPLIVHAIKFGGGYVGATGRALAAFN